MILWRYKPLNGKQCQRDYQKTLPCMETLSSDVDINKISLSARDGHDPKNRVIKKLIYCRETAQYVTPAFSS